MADDAPFPLYGSTFSDQGEQPPADIPFPLYGSTFGKETIRDPDAAKAGTGLSGVPAQRGTWEDVAHYGAAGVHELGATGAGFMASVSGDPTTEAGWRQAAEAQQQAAQESREQVTPTVQPGLSHPIMWAAEQAPSLAAMAIPAAIASAATAPIGGVGGPILLGGVMGAQATGEAYNRFTGEGIRPTAEQLIGPAALGVATGLASEVTGGLVSKIPVSPLVRRALGITGDAAAFGAGNAGQEYASQQSEIAAGRRDRTDLGEVGGVFMSGAETGAGFSLPHLLGSGRHRDLTQTPGAPSVAREDPAAQRDQAKARAPASPPGGDQANLGPSNPTTADKVDAAQGVAMLPDDDKVAIAKAASDALLAKIKTRKAELGITPTSDTLESNQQAGDVEQQSEVVQPGPSAAGTATEAPPADVATGQGSPPPSRTGAQPAPGAAPAGEVVAPEPQSTIQAQHAALLDPNDPRELMVYNKGEQPIDITGNDGIGQTRLKDGRVVQYDKQGPSALTPKKIGAFARVDPTTGYSRLNELLQNSTVDKNKAVDLAVAGVGEPAVVTTRKPDGTEVKAGATTTAVAPDDVALHQATAAPGNTVQVETPDQTIGDRFAKQREENVAAQAITPESKPEPVVAAPIDPLAGATKLSENKFGVSVHQMPDGTYRKVKDGVVTTISEDTAKILTGEKTYASETSTTEAIRQQADKEAPAKGRVLRSETPEEQEAAARQAEADRAAAERVASEAAAPPKVKPIKEKEDRKPGNLDAKARIEKEGYNAVADSIVSRPENRPGDEQEKLASIDPKRDGHAAARLLLKERVKRMVKAAEDGKFKFMEKVKDRLNTPHSNAAVILHEAKLLLSKMKTKDASDADYGRFLHNEDRLLNGGREGYEEVLGMRSQTGREIAAERGKGVKEGAEGDVEGSAAGIAKAEEDAPDVAEEIHAAKERLADEKAAKEEGKREKTPEELRAEEAGKRAAEQAKKYEVKESDGIADVTRKLESAKALARDQSIGEEERDNAMRGVHRLQEALREKTEAASRPRERATVTPEGDEPAVKGYADRTAAFKVEKRRTVTKPKGSYIEEEGKPLTDAEREDFHNAGWTDGEISGYTPDEARAKFAEEIEAVGGLVGPEHYLHATPEQVEALQVPNREKDPSHINLETSKGRWFSLKVRRNSNVRDMLHEIADEVRQSGFATGELAHDFLQRILTLVGDVPVRYLSKKEIGRFAAADLGESARIIKPGGFYSWDTHQILINDQPELHEWSVHTKFHEAIHAATSLAMDRYPEFKAQIKQIMDAAYWKERADELGGTSYAFKDEHEFVAEIFSNPKLREYLAERNIPNDLKKSLVDLAAWRKLTGFKRALKTMWDLTAMLIGKVLKLPPRGVSYLEATLHLTEKYMEQHAKDVAAGEPIKFMAPKTGDAIRSGNYIKQPEEQVKASAKEAQDATRKPWEFWKTELAKATKSGAQEAGYKAFTKASNFDTLRVASEHLFGRRDDNNSFRRVQEGTAKMDQAIRTMLGEHDPLVQRISDVKKANPDGLDRIVTLLSESADYGVHPDHALGQGLNSYINPRSKKFDETAAQEHHEAILAHPRLSDEYNRSTPDEQKLFRDLRDGLMVEGKKNAQAHYDSFSDALKYNFEKDEKLQDILSRGESTWSPAELKKVERYAAVTKVLSGDKLEDDEKEQFHNDPQISALRELKNLQKQQEPYMPSTRKGEWVVNGEHDIPKPKNALSQKDNEAVFATLKDAYDYRKTLVDNSLPSTLETIKEPTTSEQGRGSGADTYRVTVQNKHSSAVEDKYTGDKMAETLRAQGVKNVTNPMLREKNEHIDYGLHSGTVRAIGHAIDALTHLSKEERQTQHDALEQASLGLMRGNRINQGLMRRNRVKGANADPVLAVHDYFAASARNRAQARFMPDINRALDEMREHARNTQDADTWKRGLLIRQAEERALNFGKDGFTGQMPNVLQNLSTLAFVKYMMAPIHYALDLTHPYLISIPQIAGRHGMAKTQVAFQKTLGDMGGRFPTLLKGGKGMWEAALKSGHMPTDFAGMIRARLEKNKATPDELRAFDQALETGALHSILMDFRPHFEKTGNVNRALQRAQSVGQEMSSAVDAINRIATYMTAYRLERSRMIGPQQPGSFAHHAQAIRYAKDVVTQTQGLYTPSNRAAMLRNPAVRSIMQFRSVPMMIYKVMARNIYDMYKPETPEVRWAAVRSFVGTMGTTALLAGGPAGIPEPIRLAVMLTHALGLTGSWEDLEDAARREADNSLGKMGGRVVMDGVLGAAGLSAGNRLGLSDLFIKGEPQSAKDFVFQLMGAQAGYATDEIKGIGQLLHGDFQHGLPTGMPIRLFADVAKAYYDNQEGKPGRGATPSMQPLDPFETLIRGLGGTPTREANYYKMTGLIQEAKTDKQSAMQSVEGRLKWNAAHPHDRISASQVKKTTQTGKPDTAKQRQTAEDYSAYQ